MLCPLFYFLPWFWTNRRPSTGDLFLHNDSVRSENETSTAANSRTRRTTVFREEVHCRRCLPIAQIIELKDCGFPAEWEQTDPIMRKIAPSSPYAIAPIPTARPGTGPELRPVRGRKEVERVRTQKSQHTRKRKSISMQRQGSDHPIFVELVSTYPRSGYLLSTYRRPVAPCSCTPKGRAGTRGWGQTARPPKR